MMEDTSEPQVIAHVTSTEVADGSTSLLWLLAMLLRARRLLLVCTITGLLVGVSIAMLRPATYSTSFAFLPESSNDGSRAGLASLAGQFGISLGALGSAGQPPQFYADLLTTREVLTPIALDSVSTVPGVSSRVPLSSFLQVSGDTPALLLDNTLRYLRKKIVSSTVAARTTGMVTVNVRTRSAEVSYEVAQKLLNELNQFNLQTRQTQARAERSFVEQRYDEARADLRAAEDRMESFMQANRVITNSPALTFERERLQRQVSLQQQIVTTLAQQFEDARIREVRDTPVITVIEHPSLAARTDPRLRGVIIVLASAAAFAIGVLAVLFREMWKGNHSSEHDEALSVLRIEWQRLRGHAE